MSDSNITTLDPQLVSSKAELSYAYACFERLFLYFGLMHPSGNLLRVHGNTPHGYLDANQEDFGVNLLSSRQIPEPSPKAEIANQPLRAVESETLSQITNTLSYQNPYKGVLVGKGVGGGMV